MDINSLKLDLEELRTLLTQAQRPNVKNMIDLEATRVAAKI